MCWFGVNFPRDLKCEILSSLTLVSFFSFKKSEQPEIVAFNRIVVNYSIHFFFIGAKTRELV